MLGKSGDERLIQARNELWYEIFSIRLDPSRDWLCKFMILKLPFLLYTNSDKRISVWDLGFGEENLLNLIGDWEGNYLFN